MNEQENVEQEVEEVVEKKDEQLVSRPSREDYDKVQEEKARKDGWVDFDDFVAAGKPPEAWKPAAAFNLFKDMRGALTRKEQEFSQRLQGVQQLAEARLAAQREELIAKRDAAIELGQVKEVHAIEKQINTLNNQPVMPPPGTDELNRWNAENPWVTEKTPKAAFARELWNDLGARGIPIAQALQVLESEVSKHFPPSARRTTVPEVEKGRPSVAFGKSEKAVTMDSLTSDEAYIWKHNSGMWKGDEKAFLRAVQDTRNAAKGGK